MRKWLAMEEETEKKGGRFAGFVVIQEAGKTDEQQSHKDKEEVKCQSGKLRDTKSAKPALDPVEKRKAHADTRLSPRLRPPVRKDSRGMEISPA